MGGTPGPGHIVCVHRGYDSSPQRSPAPSEGESVFLLKREKPTIVQVQATLVWEGYHDPKSHTWIGVCKALNLNAIGDTWDELQECANDAMQALFLDLFQTGELEAFLRANDWRRTGELPPAGGRVRFDVPSDWRKAARVDDLVPA